MKYHSISKLHDACLSGDAQYVSLQLKNGERTDTLNENGQTPIFVSVLGGYLDIVKILVKAGASLKQNISGSEVAKKTTLLHAAAFGGHEVLFDYLISQGIDLKAKDHIGASALHWAAWSGNPQACQHLLELGSDINDTDMDGKTALHWSAKRSIYGFSQREAASRVLILAGADPRMTDKHGQSAVDLSEAEDSKDRRQASMLKSFSGMLDAKEAINSLLNNNNIKNTNINI